MAARPNAAYRPITRAAFDVAARRAGIKARDRDHVYEWIITAQENGQTWWSAHHAVHTFVVRRMARQNTKEAPPTPAEAGR